MKILLLFLLLIAIENGSAIESDGGEIINPEIIEINPSITTDSPSQRTVKLKDIFEQFEEEENLDAEMLNVEIECYKEIKRRIQFLEKHLMQQAGFNLIEKEDLVAAAETLHSIKRTIIQPFETNLIAFKGIIEEPDHNLSAKEQDFVKSVLDNVVGSLKSCEERIQQVELIENGLDIETIRQATATVLILKGVKADTSSLNNYGRFGQNNGGGGGHAGGSNGAHDAGAGGGHNEPQSQYSGVLPPVTLGGGGGGVNQYTAGAGAGRDEGAPAPEYFGTAESDYYDDYATDGGNGNAGADEGGSGEGEGSLEDSIPGVPGTDYPIYADIPETGFTCEDKVAGGYYADPEGECQVFHICAGGPAGELFKFNFLCPNGTIFNQEFFICDWWFNFDCAEAEEFYSKNDDNAAAAAAVDEAAAEAKAADQEAAGGDVVESPTGERPNQKGYSSPTGGRKGGGNNGGNNGSRRGGNGSAGGRRPKPQTGYGAPNGDEGLPPLASYGK